MKSSQLNTPPSPVRRRLLEAAIGLFVISIPAALHAAPPTTAPTYAIVIHGGAENIPADMKPDDMQIRIAGLTAALNAGKTILASGGTALDAVEESVRTLEDNERFNAGKGAVFNAAGKHELDAAIMDGTTLNAGAVGAVTTIKNPIVMSRLVMDKSGTVLLCGAGAEAFADQYPEIARVPNSYFDTPWRWDALQRKLKHGKDKPATQPADQPVDTPAGMPTTRAMGPSNNPGKDPDGGTVGCVAIDSAGHMAAATSTGGLTAKRVGRVGDTPQIGTGTYANLSAAVSGTGIGEEFIRHTIAREVAEEIEFHHLTAQQAAELVIKREFKPNTGGVIVVDHDGNIGLFFNTTGMYRGFADSTGKFGVAMFRDKQ